MQDGDGDEKIPAQQRTEARRLLSFRGSEISGALGVSPSTVRRDPGMLEREEHLRRRRGSSRRTHGLQAPLHRDAATAVGGRPVGTLDVS